MTLCQWQGCYNASDARSWRKFHPWSGTLFKNSLSALAAALMSAAVWAGEAPDLVIEDAWIRALPPTVKNTAGYLSVTNNTDSVQAVVAARSEIADKVELHTTVREDGMVRMQKLPGVPLAVGETVAFAPGGAHLMLLGLAYAPAPGDNIEICLILASGDEACTEASVRRDGGGGHDHH